MRLAQAKIFAMNTTDTGTFTVMDESGQTREVLETTTYAHLGGQLQPFTTYRFVDGGVLHQRSESVFACESTGALWKRA